MRMKDEEWARSGFNHVGHLRFSALAAGGMMTAAAGAGSSASRRSSGSPAIPGQPTTRRQGRHDRHVSRWRRELRRAASR